MIEAYASFTIDTIDFTCCIFRITRCMRVDFFCLICNLSICIYIKQPKWGNRILMMDSGNIVLDIGGEEKKNMTVEGLLEKFRSGAGKALDNDRILLSD